MAWKLLLPWFQALAEAGYEVHIACAKTSYFKELEGAGFNMHDIQIQRRMNPLMHIGPLFNLYRLIRQHRFGIVNMHSPVAAAVGRIAAQLARTPAVLYTVHGFYFHDDMPRWKRRGFIALEWLLGRLTNVFMFVSDEDRQTALREGIAKDPSKAVTIYNGVNLNAFPPKDFDIATGRQLRRELHIPDDACVTGIVGRLVREKGYIEFAEMAAIIAAQYSNVFFMVVGDALPSDRDGITEEFKHRLARAGLMEKFRFLGFTDRVADCLQAMDIFVLPSYREGFPRSVLEAMSSALPVVTTSIRGCREAVVAGETGLIVPPRDSAALAQAVASLIENPSLARKMGVAGRARAIDCYDQRVVQHRFKTIFSTVRTR